MKDRINWCFIYKGGYKKDQIAGVEARYLSLAEQYILQGDNVSFISKSDENTHIHHYNLAKVIRTIYVSDNIILHGGGPILLVLLMLFSLLFKKKVALDAYAPHWLELYSASAKRIPLKIKAKIGINISRVIWAGLFFHNIIVANPRQLDLARGFLAGVGLLERLADVTIITTGSPEKVGKKQSYYRDNINFTQTLTSGDGEKIVFIGWLGGMWDWLNVSVIYKAIKSLPHTERKRICLVYYGLNDEKKCEINTLSESFNVESLFFNWVNFDKRILEWSNLDAAFVWSEPSLENDYASRTRNFDCISAGLPIIQNHDDFWGPLIKEKDIGYVATTEKELTNVFRMILNTGRLDIMRSNISKLHDDFSWKRISSKFRDIFDEESSSYRGIVSIVLAVAYLPLILLSSLTLKK